jgi:hypothetical protein
MTTFQKLVLQMLAAILHNVMSIKERQTGSQYSWSLEYRLLQKVYQEAGGDGREEG